MRPTACKRLNHGIGFNTAAIELLLPTYGERLGLKGKIATHWALNPHPTLIPAIEAGWVKQIHSLRLARSAWRIISAPGPTSTSPGPTARCAPIAPSARPPGFMPATCSSARRCRSTCDGNSLDRHHLAHRRLRRRAQHGRRRARPAPSQRALAEGRARRPIPTVRRALRRGRKLVVQIGRDLRRQERADLRREARRAGARRKTQARAGAGHDLRRRRHATSSPRKASPISCSAAPTDEREQAIRGVAGYTDVGRGRDRKMVRAACASGASIRRPEDLGIDPLDADRSLLAARSIKDLVHWSGGLYAPPSRFRNW